MCGPHLVFTFVSPYEKVTVCVCVCQKVLKQALLVAEGDHLLLTLKRGYNIMYVRLARSCHYFIKKSPNCRVLSGLYGTILLVVGTVCTSPVNSIITAREKSVSTTEEIFQLI